MHAGTPSVFLRTYYCNLTCTWCDTKYTWLNQSTAQPGVDYQPIRTEEVLGKLTGYGCKHLVVTGGEPLLHQKLLAPLLSQLKELGFFIEVETNGTIAPGAEVLECTDSFNVSPKTSNSLVEPRARTRPFALQAFARSGKAWFKFVVCKPEDLVEIEAMISSHDLPRSRVILMPEGTDVSTLSDRSRWLIEVCTQQGFRFSPRLHILLFGNKRGA